MSFAYDGLACISFKSEGNSEPVVFFNTNIPVQLHEDEPLALATAHFTGRLQRPDHAQHVTVMIPGGMTFSGPVVESVFGSLIGWLCFQVETDNLA
jgi:hypothetical protein